MTDVTRKLSAEDRLDIQELFAKYTWGLDTGNFDAVMSCFAEDGFLQHPPQGECHGKEGIRGLLQELWHDKGKNWFKGRQHLASNYVIAPEGPDGARVKAFWSILQFSLDYHNTFVFAIGNWDNSCVKVDGEWKFKAVRVYAWVGEDEIPWDGDLSKS